MIIETQQDKRYLAITVPIAIPPELNPNFQYHGPGQNGIKARSIGYLKEMTRLHAISARNNWWWQHGGKDNKEWTPLEKALITVTIVLPPRAKRWDTTNIRAALKPAEDELVQVGIIQDDNPTHLTWNEIQFERGVEAGIRIEVQGG